MAELWKLPGNNRSPSAQILAIFLLVAEHADGGCSRLPWRVLPENWNRTNPAALYEVFEQAEARRILKQLEFDSTPLHSS
jgi:hypothetical protein